MYLNNCITSWRFKLLQYKNTIGWFLTVLTTAAVAPKDSTLSAIKPAKSDVNRKGKLPFWNS